jgi:gamma-glutamyl-gamma-aminobutyrate hydrolase PuuD
VTRPRIGVTTYSEPASWSYWRGVHASVVPTAYIESVRAAGGIPYLLPPIAEIGTDAHEVVASLHGLVVVGGSDVDPGHYGEVAHAESAGWHPTRDVVEAALIRAALEADLPYLGVCRGLQLLNVVRGGTLLQHLPAVVADPLRHRPGPGQYGRHHVDVASGSRLGELLGEHVEVVSCHHQAPDRVGEGLAVAARDSEDGVVEALEDPELRFCVGVQWHPEEDLDGSGLTLFRSLVAHAARHRDTATHGAPA